MSKIYSNTFTPLEIIDETDRFIICSSEGGSLFTFAKKEKNQTYYENLEDLVVKSGFADEIKDKLNELKHRCEILANLKETFIALIRNEFKAEVLSLKLTGILSGNGSDAILFAIASNIEDRIEKILNNFKEGNFDFYYEAKKTLKL